MRRQLAGPLQAHEAGKEVLHVPMAEGCGVDAAVAAPREVLGQQPDGADDGPHRPRRHGAESLGRPRLSRRLQPRLSDGPGRLCAWVATACRAPGERQTSGGSPQAQVPDVGLLLGAGIGAGQGDPVGGEGEKPPHRSALRCCCHRVSDVRGTAPAQVSHHAAQVRGQDSSSLGHRRLDAVEHLGDHVVIEARQHDPPAAVSQAGRGAGAESGEVGAAGDAPGPVMSSAQPGLTAGGEALTCCRRAGPKARPGLGRGVSVVAIDVGRHAPAPPAPEPVAAQAQVVGPDRAFEAGDPAHQAAPVA